MASSENDDAAKCVDKRSRKRAAPRRLFRLDRVIPQREIELRPISPCGMARAPELNSIGVL